MNWLPILDNLLTLVLALGLAFVIVKVVACVLADFAGCDD